MIYNFPDGKRQSDWLEDELALLKKDYQKPTMPQAQVEKLKARLKEADMEDRQGRKNQGPSNIQRQLQWSVYSWHCRIHLQRLPMQWGSSLSSGDL